MFKYTGPNLLPTSEKEVNKALQLPLTLRKKELTKTNLKEDNKIN